LKNNQTSPSHATQETTLLVSPHTKKHSPIPNPLKNHLLGKGVELPHPPSSPKKKPFEKNKNLNPSSPFS
jgi:hypothetical protein